MSLLDCMKMPHLHLSFLARVPYFICCILSLVNPSLVKWHFWNFLWPQWNLQAGNWTLNPVNLIQYLWRVGNNVFRQQIDVSISVFITFMYFFLSLKTSLWTLSNFQDVTKPWPTGSDWIWLASTSHFFPLQLGAGPNIWRPFGPWSAVYSAA